MARTRTGSFLLCAALLAACATPQARRTEFISAHPSLSADIKSAIVRGDIIRGMASEDVRAAWGEPENIVSELLANGKNSVTWYYTREYGEYLNTYEIRFADGRVVEVRSKGAPQPAVVPQAPAVNPRPGVIIDNDVVNARRYLDIRNRLDLTPGQVSRLEEIRQRYRIEYAQKQDLIRMNRQEMTGLLYADVPDTSLIRNKMDDIARLQDELRTSLLNALQAASSVLTPEQRLLLQNRTVPQTVP